ncbi:pentapeptide repeat-containing protein [Leptolyngbya iicbica]
MYKNREKLHRPGDADSDWQAAEQIVQSPIQRLLLRGNSQLIARLNPSTYQILKGGVWDAPKWALTGLLVKLPKAEWVKLLAVPLAVAVAGTIITRNFQREAEQNRILKEYFTLLETFTFERELLTQPLDSGVVILARGRTVTALRELDRDRREQLFAFLRASDLATIAAEEPADKSAQSPDTATPNAEETEVLTGETIQNPDELAENPEAADENAAPIPEPVISFRDQDLSEMDLRNVNLSNLDFPFTNFREANLEGTNFNDANLQNAILWGASLQKAYLWNTDLRDSSLSKANLQDASLWNANLQKAYLGEANLRNAMLWNANLQSAILRNANLQGAELQQANLQDANLGQNLISLEQTNLQDTNLGGANLQNAMLWNANLQSAILRNANLQGAELQQANLQDADLQDANLEFVNLAGADLRRVSYLTEEQLAEAILCGTKLPDYIELDGNRDCNTP